MPERILKTRVAQKSRTPTTPVEWNKLMKKAIERAQAQQDRRLDGLQRMAASGNPAQHLRRLGIICENDLLREFPERKT